MDITKKQVIPLFFVLVGLVFIVRLFCIQLLSNTYQVAAEKNIVRRVVEAPYRGLIYDRNHLLLTANAPMYDLMVIPKQIQNLDTQAFCKDFTMPLPMLEQTLSKAKRYSYVKPSRVIKDISPEKWAWVQDHLIAYRGFFVTARTVRTYPRPICAHVLGYVGEIDGNHLIEDPYYRQGDLLGISGLEKKYEVELRGQYGIGYKITDVRGLEIGCFREGVLDRRPIAGKNLITTIDATLQAYGEQLMQGKTGSIVMIEPQTGEILAMVSSPSYNPNHLVGQQMSHHFASLTKDPRCPIFNRPVMATYPPGSIFKLIQALIALQEKVITPDTRYPCDRRQVNCHAHPSPTNLHQAIRYSCNPYFYRVFKQIVNQKIAQDPAEDTRLGLDKWVSYVEQFGLGKPLGVDLPHEKGGLIPGVAFYDTHCGQGNWQVSTIRSLDIGQGELLMTPLQIANVAAIIANRGYYYTPHVIKQIGDMTIDSLTKKRVGIHAAHFELVIDAMQETVAYGSARRACIPTISVCGKTGTVQNKHGKDHAVFMGFAPKEVPQVAIAVYVENAGWGARAAAAMAGLMLEKYLTGTISRLSVEDYVRQGNFD